MKGKENLQVLNIPLIFFFYKKESYKAMGRSQGRSLRTDKLAWYTSNRMNSGGRQIGVWLQGHYIHKLRKLHSPLSFHFFICKVCVGLVKGSRDMHSTWNLNRVVNNWYPFITIILLINFKKLLPTGQLLERAIHFQPPPTTTLIRWMGKASGKMESGGPWKRQNNLENKSHPGGRMGWG